MKKRIIVKRKHRYEHESDVMYKGLCEWIRENDCIKLMYQEINNDVEAKVEVHAYANYMEIRRQGETQSRLRFDSQTETIGELTSAYGTIQIHIHTYKYIRKDNIITLEYDILTDGNVTNGYHILWNIKEE